MPMLIIFRNKREPLSRSKDDIYYRGFLEISLLQAGATLVGITPLLLASQMRCLPSTLKILSASNVGIKRSTWRHNHKNAKTTDIEI